MDDLKLLCDEQLITLYREGYADAFDCLLNRHKDRLYSYIFFTVHNSDLADDIFQETFVKAIITIRQGRYTESGKFYAWLTCIARNLIFDLYRKERTESTISNDEAETDLLNNAEIVDSYTEADMVNEQTLHDAERLMNSLPDSQREVVFMRIYQDMSFKEISDATGVSINTALGRMRYAIINMRRMAKEHGISLSII